MLKRSWRSGAAALAGLVVAAGMVVVGVGGVAPAGASSSTSTKKDPVSPGMMAVGCPSTTVCYAVGESSSGVGDVLKTTDDGTTWKTQTLPAGTSTLSLNPPRNCVN